MLFRNVVAAAFGLMVSVLPAAAQDFIAGIPRNEALIIQGPPAQNADWFNLWAPGGGANNNGLQQLTGRHLLVHQPRGTGKSAWTNALATEPPAYNDDFTQMTVKLREGIYWSDGVEFTADDVVYTVETQIAHPGMGWSAPFTVNVESVEAPDPRHRRLQAQGAELALPHPLHRALERGLDHAQARLREGRGSARLPEQPAGLAQRLRACTATTRPGSG